MGSDLFRVLKNSRVQSVAALASALVFTPTVWAAFTSYSVTNLVSDQTGMAAHMDTDLVNPWGIVFNPNGFVWIANNGSGTSTLYDGTGAKNSLTVTVPAGKTKASFSVKTRRVRATTIAALTASYSGSSLSASVTLTP